MVEEIRKTRFQQIEEEIKREYYEREHRKLERLERAEKARWIRRNRAIIEIVKRMDEGSKSIQAYTKSPKEYIKTLEAIDFTIQRSGGKQRGKGKHTILRHDDYPELEARVSGNTGGKVQKEFIKELKEFIKDINDQDALPKNKGNKEKRSAKGRAILALDIR